jgi:hypothetical protein
MRILPHPAELYNPLTALFQAVDDAERAVYPERVYCAGCVTFAAAACDATAMEDKGRYAVPVQCGCGGWRLSNESATRAASYLLATYRGAVWCRWGDLTGGYAPIDAAWCILTLPNGYAVHRTLPNGTLGALIERVEVTR